MIKFAGALLASAISLGMTAHAAPLTPNGVLLEKAPLPADHGLSEASAQYLIHYTSISGIDGKTHREDSGAVFLPKGPAPEGGWPVVVWTHGTVGVAYQCAPSLNPRTPRDQQYLNSWLSLGFAVVAPDYAGLGSPGLHHYLNSRSEAWSVLDSISASLKSFPLSNKIIIIGQSQGAHAAFAASGYQPSYAPALHVLGTVLTGTPYINAHTTVSDIFKSTHNRVGGDPKMPYAYYIFLSAADENKQLKAADYFQKRAVSDVKLAETLCIAPLTRHVMTQGLNDKNSFQPDFQGLLDSQLPSLRYNTLKINHPVFIGIGLNDINVPTAMQQQFAREVKAAGTPVEVKEYAGMDHSETVNVSLRDSVPFVFKVMSGAQ
ncbi:MULTISPECIES: lipase family protein [unclassified Tatumella]|uniref:lipase family protein n=1 Tax=unclassified Tatumella TaxID=2649542 RepID=UPI001BAF56C8|nr:MULTISPECIES: lipase family protein [unclassified Tatumella]MBS0877805.1 alpha/beta hydrolase [Tatumella sp. JGM82]MBS0891510.1 alpha/beta hydrolase [Tatumella sp. JGM94]MBS0902440.1 alpha/beta hydrolase [Tatumella sp. JGM100]